MKRVLLSITILFICISSFACNNNSSSENYDPENALFHDGLLGMCKEDLCGYVNDKFNEEIGFKYTFVGEFQEGRARVSKDGSAGVIDNKGKEILPFEFHTLLLYPDSKTIETSGLFMQNTKYYDYEGQELTYTEFYTLQGYGEDDLISFKGYLNQFNNLAYGYKNIEGEIVIPLYWDSVKDTSFTDKTLVEKEHKYHFIDNNGAVSVYLGFNDFSSTLFEGYLSVGDFNDNWGLIDSDGEWIIEMKYAMPIYLNENGYGIIKSYSNKFGLVDYEGNIVVDTIYNMRNEDIDHKLNWETGFVILYDDDGSMLYNSNAELVYQSEYQIMEANDKYIILTKGNTFEQYLYDYEGNELMGPYTFINIDISNSEYLYVCEGLKPDFRVYNMDLTQINPDFESYIYNPLVTNLSDKAFIELLNIETMRQEVYNEEFELLFSYDPDDEVTIYSDGFIVIERENSISFYDFDGDLLWFTTEYYFK